MPLTVANQITLVRLLLAVAFFIVLAQVGQAWAPDSRGWLAAAFWLFLVAAVTDVLDGYVARAWNQQTAFGRVIDPAVDKVLVCGAFAFLAGDAYVSAGGSLTGVHPWMVVVILSRELLVSSLRSESERGGADFAASLSGKLKMLLQSVAVCVVLGRLAWFEALDGLARVLVWAAVVATVLSVVPYLWRARGLLAGAGGARPGRAAS